MPLKRQSQTEKSCSHPEHQPSERIWTENAPIKSCNKRSKLVHPLESKRKSEKEKRSHRWMASIFRLFTQPNPKEDQTTEETIQLHSRPIVFEQNEFQAQTEKPAELNVTEKATLESLFNNSSVLWLVIEFLGNGMQSFEGGGLNGQNILL